MRKWKWGEEVETDEKTKVGIEYVEKFENKYVKGEDDC